MAPTKTKRQKRTARKKKVVVKQIQAKERRKRENNERRQVITRMSSSLRGLTNETGRLSESLKAAGDSVADAAEKLDDLVNPPRT